MTEFVRRFEEDLRSRGVQGGDGVGQGTCHEGEDHNAPETQRTRQQKDTDWELSVKMAMIARDMMIGNLRLAELGFGEEAMGHNAIASGFQGQRQWTDHFPNGDFMERSSTPPSTGTASASLCGRHRERRAQRHLDAVWPSVDRARADLLRRADLLEPRGGEAGDWVRADRRCSRGLPAPDQLRFDGPGCDRPADVRRQAGDEAVVGRHR